MLEHLRASVRAVGAWIVGCLLFAVVGFLGPVSTAASPGGVVSGYAVTHSPEVDPLWLLALPAVVVAVAGYRAGTGARSGVRGRFRALMDRIKGSDRGTLVAAARAGLVLSGWYALVVGAAAVLAGASVVVAFVWPFVLGVVVGVPAAVVGAVR